MMTSRALSVLVPCTFAWLACACGATPTPVADPPQTPSSAPPGALPDALPVDVAPSTDRPELSTQECEARGAAVVGDIGDGAVHRPDYKCPSGAAPIGRIALGIEGSVCCP